MDGTIMVSSIVFLRQCRRTMTQRTLFRYFGSLTILHAKPVCERYVPHSVIKNAVFILLWQNIGTSSNVYKFVLPQWCNSPKCNFVVLKCLTFGIHHV